MERGLKKFSPESSFWLTDSTDVEYILMQSNMETKVMRTARKGKDPSGRELPVELTEGEWEIMKVVWEKQPCTAGTVQEELMAKRDRAYSTVKTTMDRMVEKGFLKIERIRNLQLFSACISEVEAKRGEFRRMLQRAFNGALTPMMQFLIEHEGLSREEASQLREFLRRAQREQKSA